ncbi:MAG: hypothetical protein JKY86_08140 [Gammaproteobacteria bacterium]|nr:hypothetical protein [Gammaproteobacteria bacterium]
MVNMTANSSPNTSVSVHPNQSSRAVELGLDVATLSSAEAVVDAIESALGKAAEEECARWFAISVLKHLRKENWASLSDSDLDDVTLMRLVKDCLAVKGFSSSLRTVTKDARSKFRIVGFASSKKIERGVLATGTKAYKIAANSLLEAGLAEGKAQQESNETPLKKLAADKRSESKVGVEKTAVERRAKRRGYVENEPESMIDTLEKMQGEDQAASMSKQEFADLDAALTKSDVEIIQQNWGDQQHEERWSRLLGILAGVGFFVFIALLFL